MQEPCIKAKHRKKSIKSWDQQNSLLKEGFVISKLFIRRFHCIRVLYIESSLYTFYLFHNLPFSRCISDNIVLIGRALQNKFIIPDFPDFAAIVKAVFEEAASNEEGQVNTSLPGADPGFSSGGAQKILCTQSAHHSMKCKVAYGQDPGPA